MIIVWNRGSPMYRPTVLDTVYKNDSRTSMLLYRI